MFEIAILSIYNGNGRRVDGHCCSGSDEPCSGECRTFVTTCLLQQTTVVPEVPDCIFGSTSSSVLGRNNINTAVPQNVFYMNITFNFLWPVSISFISYSNIIFHNTKLAKRNISDWIRLQNKHGNVTMN